MSKQTLTVEDRKALVDALEDGVPACGADNFITCLVRPMLMAFGDWRQIRRDRVFKGGDPAENVAEGRVDLRRRPGQRERSE